jgi:hypothetical protein
VKEELIDVVVQALVLVRIDGPCTPVELAVGDDHTVLLTVIFNLIVEELRCLLKVVGVNIVEKGHFDCLGSE